MSYSRLLIVTVVLLISANAAMADPAAVQDPEYDSWAKCEPGTAVVAHYTTKVGDNSMEWDEVQILMAVEAEGATVLEFSAKDIAKKPPEGADKLYSGKVKWKSKVVTDQDAAKLVTAFVAGENVRSPIDTLPLSSAKRVTTSADGGPLTLWGSPEVPGVTVKVTSHFKNDEIEGDLQVELRSVRKLTKDPADKLEWNAKGFDPDQAPIGLLMQAAEKMLPELAKYWQPLGGDLYTQWEKRTLLQCKSVGAEVPIQKLTEADRLNGITWRGRIELNATSYRPRENGVWSEWKSEVPGQIFGCRLTKENGTWKIQNNETRVFKPGNYAPGDASNPHLPPQAPAVTSTAPSGTSSK